MPSSNQWIAFLVASILFIQVPGPSLLFMLGRALTVSRRDALLSVVGNALGLVVQVLLVAIGLGAVVAASATAYTALKLVGAAYVVWLGVQAVRHRADARTALLGGVAEAEHAGRALAAGLVVGVTNPKTIVFFVAFLPQFTSAGAAAGPQLAVLGLVFAALAVLSDSTWAVLAEPRPPVVRARAGPAGPARCGRRGDDDRAGRDPGRHRVAGGPRRGDRLSRMPRPVRQPDPRRDPHHEEHDEHDDRDRMRDLRSAIDRTGYYPEVVADGVEGAVGGEQVVSFFVHHEPTFERDEVRRHQSVVVLTPTRLVLAHTDEHTGDDLLPEPYTSTSTESVRLSAVKSVVVTRMTANPTSGPKTPAEAVLTIGWGGVSRVDLEPAGCSDPECDADHGYTGVLASDDFSLRVSAAADGADAVAGLLAFADSLSARTHTA